MTWHLHRWTRWQDECPALYGDLVVGVIQERRCTKCGKLKQRESLA